MSREIKFRAWNENIKVMNYFCRLEVVVEEANLVLGGWLDASQHKVTDLIAFAKTKTVLMQYTGLKDCKGNEIYEGDIVRIKRPLWDWRPNNALVVEHLVEIKWVEETCGFRDAGAVTDGEVIGNIYENSNLLGAKS